MEILKVHFGKGQNGKWEIDGINSIPLGLIGDADATFLPIKDDLVINQAAFPRTTKFVLGQSVVPIVAHVQGESTLRCLGTGFFISCSGLLITAAHVITDPIERQYGGIEEADELTWHAHNLHLGVMIPLDPLLQSSGHIFRSIEWATFLSERTDHVLPFTGVNLKHKSDVAICQVEPISNNVPHQPLITVQAGMIGKGMAVGKRATAIGYGEMRNVELTRKSNNILSGDFFFDLHASRGTILERFPDNFLTPSAPAPGPCFSASLQLPGGMSGSPIFDDEGIYVHGVVSIGSVDDSGPAKFGYGCMLAHSLGVPIKQLGGKSLLELHKTNEHGFAMLQGSDI